MESKEKREPVMPPLPSGAVRMKRVGGECIQIWTLGGVEKAATLLPGAKIDVDGDVARTLLDRDRTAWEVLEGHVPPPPPEPTEEAPRTE